MSNSTPPPPEEMRGSHGESGDEIEEKTKDRLSDLPDCILLHILSFASAKYAVQTCVLSKKWKNLWKSIPNLILHSSDFNTPLCFINFVFRLLILRDGAIPLRGLDFDLMGLPEPLILLEKVVNYARSHTVQQIALAVKSGIEHIPPCIFSCLTSLKLSVNPDVNFRNLLTFPKSLNLPALITLHLENFAFRANGNYRLCEPFSAFIRLNTLIIDNCSVSDAHILFISNATLTNLTVLNYYDSDLHRIQLSSPNLRSLAFKGTPCLLPSGSNLSSLKQVNIDVELWSPETIPTHQPPIILLSWLLKLANIKSLTVSASTLQVLYSVPNIIKMKLPLWDNLKRLKIEQRPSTHVLIRIMRCVNVMLANADTASSREAAKLKKDAAILCKKGLEPTVPLPDGIVDFLIQNSPSAEVETVDCLR